MNILKIDEALVSNVAEVAIMWDVIAIQGRNSSFDPEDEWVSYALFPRQGFALPFCDGTFYHSRRFIWQCREFFHHKAYGGDLPGNIFFSTLVQRMMARLGLLQ